MVEHLLLVLKCLLVGVHVDLTVAAIEQVGKHLLILILLLEDGLLVALAHHLLLVVCRQLIAHVAILIALPLHVVNLLLSPLILLLIFGSRPILPQHDVFLMFELNDFKKVSERFLELLFGEFDLAELVTHIPIGHLPHLPKSRVAFLLNQ